MLASKLSARAPLQLRMFTTLSQRRDLPLEGHLGEALVDSCSWPNYSPYTEGTIKLLSHADRKKLILCSYLNFSGHQVEELRLTLQ